MSNQEHTDGLTRRTLIKSTALGSLALAAGGLSLPFSLSHAAAAVQDAAHGEERIVWGACSVNCGSRCALRSHVRDDEVVWVETDNTGADIYGDHQVRACLLSALAGRRRWIRSPTISNASSKSMATKRFILTTPPGLSAAISPAPPLTPRWLRV